MYPFQIALNLRNLAHTTAGQTIRGRLSRGPLLPKRGLVVPKVFTPKNCISRFQGRWTLRCCMKATQSLKKKIIFNTSTLGGVGKMAKMPKLGHIYPWDMKAHIIWHIAELEHP